MSTKQELTELAQSDTPSAVNVPQSWQGLIVWIIGRFGILAVVSIVFGLATKQVYQDMSGVYQDMRGDRADLVSDRAQLLDAYREQTKALESNTKTTESFSRTIDAHTEAIKANTRAIERALTK